MAKKYAPQLPLSTMSGGMQPVSSDNIKESFKPTIPGEQIISETELYDPKKYRWGNAYSDNYVPPFYGKYYQGSAADPSPETIQGENQPWTGKLANGVIANTFGIFTKATTMLAEPVGGLYDLLTNINPDTAEERKQKYGTSFPHLFENFMTTAMKYAEDELLEKQLLPVYGGQKYFSDNIWTKMGDMKMWSTDAADMAAFTLAALATTKGFGLAAKGLKMTKMVKNASGAMEEVLSTNGKMFQAIGSTLANTAGEAAYEGYDNLQASRSVLAEKKYNTTYDNLSKEQKAEINREVGPYAANVFNANSALLLIPNLIQTRFFMGPVKSSSDKLIKAIKTGKFKASDVSKLRRTLKLGALGAMSEGLWEEGIQNAVQNYEKSKIDDSAFLNRIPGYGYEWLNGWYTTEGQQSMLFGALLGGATGAARGFIDAGQEKAQAAYYKNRYDALLKGSASVADNTLIDIKHPYRIFETTIKDKDGNDKNISTIINPATGKPEIDYNKFIKLLRADTFNKEVTENLLMASLNNDEVQEKFIINQALSQYFFRYADSDMFDNIDEAYDHMIEKGGLKELAQDEDLKKLGYDFDYMQSRLGVMKEEWKQLNDKLKSSKDVNDDSDAYKKFRLLAEKTSFYNRMKLRWLDDISNKVEDKEQLDKIREDANSALNIVENKKERDNLYKEYISQIEDVNNIKQQLNEERKKDATSIQTKMYEYLEDEERKIHGSNRLHDIFTITERPSIKTGMLGLKNQHYFNIAADAIVGVRIEDKMRKAQSPDDNTDLLDIVDELTRAVTGVVETTGKNNINESDIDKISELIPILEDKLNKIIADGNNEIQTISENADIVFNETQDDNIYKESEQQINDIKADIEKKQSRHDEALRRLFELRSMIVDLPQGRGFLNYKDGISKLEKDDNIFLRNVADEPIEDAKDALEIAKNTKEYDNYPKIKSLLDSLYERKKLYSETKLKERLNLKQFKGYIESIDKIISDIEGDFIKVVEGRYNKNKNFDKTNQKSTNKKKFLSIGIGLDQPKDNNIIDRDLYNKIADVIGITVLDGIITKASDASEVGEEYEFHEIFVDKIISLLKIAFAKSADKKKDFMEFIQEKYNNSLDEFDKAWSPLTSEVSGNYKIEKYKKNPKRGFQVILSESIGLPSEDNERRSATEQFLIDNDIAQYYENLKSEKDTGYPSLDKDVVLKIVEAEIAVESLQELMLTLESNYNVSEEVEEEENYFSESKTAPTNQQIHALRQITQWFKKELKPVPNEKNLDRNESQEHWFKNWAFAKGNAGTGKTQVLIKIMLRVLGIKPSEVQFIAPHKMALDMIEGQKLSTNDPILNENLTIINEKVKVVVIDEIAAFTEVDLFTMAEKLYNINKERAFDDRFRVIVLGDPSQVQKKEEGTKTSYDPSINGISQIGIEHIFNTDPLTIKFRSIITEINEFLEIFEGSKKDVKGISVYASLDRSISGESAIGIHAGNQTDMNHMLERHKSNKRNKIIVVSDEYKKNKFIADHPEFRDQTYTYREVAGIEIDEVYIGFAKDEFIDIAEYNTALYTAASRAKEYIFINNDKNNFDNVSRYSMHQKFYGDKEAGVKQEYLEEFNKSIRERSEKYTDRLEFEKTVLNDGVIKKNVKKDNVTKKTKEPDIDIKNKDIDDIYQDQETDTEGEEEEDSSDNVRDAVIDVPKRGGLIHKVKYTTGLSVNKLKPSKRKEDTLDVQLLPNSEIIYIKTRNTSDSPGAYTIHILGQLYKSDGSSATNTYAHLGIVSNEELNTDDFKFLKDKADSTDKFGAISDYNSGITSIKNKKSLNEDIILANGNIKLAKPLEYVYSWKKTFSGRGFLDKVYDLIMLNLFSYDINANPEYKIRIFTQKELASDKFSSLKDKSLSAGVPYLIINKKKNSGFYQKSQFIRLNPQNISGDNEIIVKIKGFYDALVELNNVINSNYSLGDSNYNEMVQWFSKYYRLEGNEVKMYDNPDFNEYQKGMEYRVELNREQFNKVTKLIEPVIRGFYGQGEKKVRVADEAAMRANNAYKDTEEYEYKFVESKSKDKSGFVLKVYKNKANGKDKFEVEPTLVAGEGEVQKQLNLLAKANEFVNGKRIRVSRLHYNNTSVVKKEKRHIISAKSLLTTNSYNAGYYNILRRLLRDNQLTIIHKVSYTQKDNSNIEVSAIGTDYVTDDNVLEAELLLQEKGIKTREELNELYDKHVTEPITMETLRDIITFDKKGRHSSLRTPLPMYQINKWGDDIDTYKDELEDILQTNIQDIIPTALQIEINDAVKSDRKPDNIHKENKTVNEDVARVQAILNGQKMQHKTRKDKNGKNNEETKLFKENSLSEPYLGRQVSEKKIRDIIKKSIPGITEEDIVFLEKQKIDTMAGTKAWGFFKDGIIYLSQDKDGNTYENVARHEVFHKVWTEYLTREERDKFIDIAEKEFPDFKKFIGEDYLDYRMEEFLAQKFHAWRRNKLQLASDWIKSLFKKILQLFNKYEVNLNTIEDLFFNIKYGIYNRRYSRADNTTRLMKDILTKFSSLDSYLNALDEVMDRLRTLRLGGSQNDYGIMLTNTEIYEQVLYDIKDKINEISIDIKNNPNRDNIPYEEAIAYYDVIVRNYKDILKDLFPGFNNFHGGEYMSELSEDIKAEIMKDKTAMDTLQKQIIENEYHNTEMDVTDEVKEILSYVKGDNGKLLSWRYVYIKMLGMLGSLSLEQDKSNDLMNLRNLIDESFKSKKKTANEEAIVKYLKNYILDNIIPNTTFDNYVVTENGKYLSYDIFVYSDDINNIKEIKHINDKAVRDGLVTTLTRLSVESSEDFANRISKETGLSLDQVGALSRLQYYNNIWNKLVNHFNSHRQRDPKIGERIISYGSYKIRYINAKGNSIINGIADNLANIIGMHVNDEQKLNNLIKNVYNWDKEFKYDNLEFVKKFLYEINLPVYAANLSTDKAALLRQDILHVFSNSGNLVKYLGKEYIGSEDNTNSDKTTDADAELQDKETDINDVYSGEEILQQYERSFLNNLSESIALVDNLSRILSSNDAKNNRRYNAVLSSQGHKNIFNWTNSKLGLKGLTSLKPMEKFDTPFFKNNIFVKGINTIHRLIDDDGFTYDTAYGQKFSVQYRNEKREDFNFRNFVLGFVNNITHSSEKDPKYIQFIAPNERKTPFGVEVNVLKRDELINAIKTSIIQIYDKIDRYDKSNKHYKNYNTNPFLGFEILPEVLGKRNIKDVNIDKLAIEIYNALDKKSKEYTKDIIADRMPFDTNMPNETKLDAIVDNKLYKDYSVSSLPQNTFGSLKLTETWDEFEADPENAEKNIDRSTAFDRGDEKKYMLTEEHLNPLVSSFFINNYVNGYHFTQMVAGDHSSYKDVHEFIKRLSIAFAPGRTGYIHDKYGMNRYARVAVIQDPVSSKEFVKTYLTALLGEDFNESDINDILSKYPEGFQPADSQGFILPERLDDINIGFGEKLGSVLKGVYFHIENDGTARAIKYSQIVLSNDICLNKDGSFNMLGRLREKMRNNPDGIIEEVVFASGIKAGVPAIQNKFEDLVDDQNDIGFKPESQFLMDNTDYRIQFNPESSIESEVSYPTQLSYIMNLYGMNDLLADDIYRSFSEIFKENFTSLQSYMTGRSLKDILKEFLKSIKQDNLANMMSENIDPNFPGITDNILIHYLSTIFDRTIKTKFPGTKLILQTAQGVEKAFADKGEKLPDIYKRELHFKRDKSGRLYAECIVPYKILPEEIEKRIKEALERGEEPADMFVYNTGTKNEISKDLLGFRIPSSEMHSGVPIKVVGFYDSRGTNVIIAPKMLVAFHGSDFDIDSLFTITRKTVPAYTPSKGHPIGYEYDPQTEKYTFNRETDWLSKIEGFDNNEKVRREVTEAYYLNRITENFLMALSDPANIVRMVTPIYVGELHNEVKAITDITKEGKQKLDVSNVKDLQELHDIVFTGDNAVGMFMNIFKAFSFMHRAYQKDNKIQKTTRIKEELLKKDQSEGKHTHRIMFNGKSYVELVDTTEKGDTTDSGVLTGERFDSLANAALDNLKEFILPYLNVGRETIRAYATMVMHGIPFRTINLFIGQPILKYSVKYGKYDATKIQKKLKAIFEGAEASIDLIPLTDDRMIKHLKRSPDYLKKILDKENRTDADNEFLMFQYATLNQYEALTNIGDEVAKVSQLANTIRNWPVKVDEMEEIIEQAKHIFGIERKDRISNNTVNDKNSSFPYYMNEFLTTNPHIRTALYIMEWTLGVVNRNFITHGPKFREISDQIFDATGIKFDRSNSLTKKKIRDEFVKFVMTSLVDVSKEVPVTYTVKRKGKEPKEIILQGPAAFNNKFINLVKKAKELDAYKENKHKNDSVPYSGNFFLKSLSIRKNWWNGREKIYFNGPSMMDSKDYNLFQQSFINLDSFDILRDKEGNIKYNEANNFPFYEKESDGYFTEFQEMFVDYAILNYGLSFGLRNYTKVLPPAIFKDTSDRLVMLLHTIENMTQEERENITEAFEAQLIQNHPEAIASKILRANSKDLKKIYVTDVETNKRVYSGVDDIGVHYDRLFTSTNSRSWPRWHMEKYNNDIVIFRRISDKIGTSGYYVRVGHKNEDQTYYLQSLNDAKEYRGDDSFMNIALKGIKMLKGTVIGGLYENKYDKLEEGQAVFISDHNDPGSLYPKSYRVKKAYQDNKTYKLEEVINDKLSHGFSPEDTEVDKLYNELQKQLRSKNTPFRSFSNMILVKKQELGPARIYYQNLNKNKFNGLNVLHERTNSIGIEILINKDLLAKWLYGRQLDMFKESEKFDIDKIINNITESEDWNKFKTTTFEIDGKTLNTEINKIKKLYDDKTPLQLLDEIESRNTNSFNKLLIRWMRPLMKKIPELKYSGHKDLGSVKFEGIFNPIDGINLDYFALAYNGRDIKYTDRVLLHEMIHAITDTQLTEDPTFRKDLLNWINNLKQYNPDIVKEFSNAFKENDPEDPKGAEFLAEFFTNEKFYNKLNEIKTPKDKLTVGQRIREWIRKIFNASPKYPFAERLNRWLKENLETLPLLKEVDNRFINYKGEDVTQRYLDTGKVNMYFSKEDSILDTIIDQGSDWHVQLDDKGEQTGQYINADGTKKYGRVSDMYNGFVSFFRKVGKNETYGERWANREWGSIPKDTKRNVEGKLMTYDEYKEYKDEIGVTTLARGRILHLINKLIVDRLFNNGYNEVKIKSEIQEEAHRTHYIKDSTGKTYEARVDIDPDKYLWYEKAIADIYEIHGINSLENLPDNLKDRIASEVMIVSDELKFAGTADLIVEHSDGTLSIKDIATGYAFDSYPTSRILKYGDQNIQITDEARSRKKLQIMLYALMIKTNNPEVKFRDLSIMWTPGEYHATRFDPIAKVEVGDYLDMIKAFLKDKVALKEAGIDENIYKTLLTKSPKLFDASEYTYEYRAKVEGLTTGQKKVQDEMIDEIATSNKEPWRKAELYLAEMQKIIGKAPVITDLGKNKYEDLGYEDRVKLLNLSEKVLQLIQDPEVALTISDKYDVSLITSILGNYSDISDPRVQTWKKLRDIFALKMTKDIDEKKREHDSLLRKVLDEYYKEHPLLIRSKKWMNFVNYKKLYSFMYKEFDNNGSTQLRMLHRDIEEDKAEYNNLTEVQRNYLDYLNKTYASYFEGEDAYANQDTAYVMDKGEYKAYSVIDLYNKELGENDKFKYYPGWFPKAPKELEEMIFEEGQGSYLKGIFNMKFIKDMLHRSVTYYIENKFEGRNHAAMVLPLKFIGSFNIDNKREYTYSGEMQFDKFITSIEYKKNMDPVYASGEAVRMFLDMQKNDGQPMYANTSKMLERKLTSDILGRTIRPRLVKKGLRPFGTKYEDRELRTDAILMLLKNWTSATLMWLKPFTGGGNGLNAIMLLHKDAIKGSISAKIEGVEQNAIDYTLAEQLWADKEYFKSFVADAARGNLEQNKIWLMLRKFRYLPDNFDYKSSEKYLLSLSNRIISESTMYAFHRIPEEFVSVVTMLAQLKHLKHPTWINPETGKKGSIYECYKVVKLPNGESDVIWNPEVPSRGKLKHGSGENTWYESMNELTAHEIAKIKKTYERLQGGYRKEEATALEVYVMGKMFMQLKKYYPRLLLNAFSSSRKEDDLGYMKKVADRKDGEDVYVWMQRINEGRFKVIGKFMINLMRYGDKSNRDYKWATMPELYKQHIIDAALTLGMWGVFYAAYGLMFGDDKDDDSMKKWWKMYMLDNFAQQYDPRELLKIGVQSIQPVAFVRALDASVALSTTIVVSGQYLVGNEDKALTRQGDLRGWNSLKKTIPGLASYYDFVKRLEESSDITRLMNTWGFNKYR